jgi:hypothetical protein
MNLEFMKKVVEAKKLFKPITFDKTGNFKNKYASLDTIMQSIFDGLASQGLSVHFTTVTVELFQKPWIFMTAHVTDGVSEITSSVHLPLDKALSATNPVQQIGSNLTYGRRYTVSCLLNLTADDDLDGQYLDDRSDKQNKDTSDKPAMKFTSKVEAKIEKTARDYAMDVFNYIQIYGRPSVASALNILEDDIPEIKSWNLAQLKDAVDALFMLLGPLQKT